MISPMNEDFEKLTFAEFENSGHIGFTEKLNNIEPVSDEWNLFDASSTQFRSSAKRVFYQFGFKIQRKVENFLFNGFIVVFILALICFAVFALEFDDVASRLNILCTLLITMVALKTVLQTNMPITPKANYVDIYVNGAIFLNVGLIFLISFSHFVEDEVTYDRWVLSVTVAAWLLFSFGFLLQLKRKVDEHHRLNEKLLSPKPGIEVTWNGM
eukprot:CAMPEP_0170080210 /NCGR_PEP_ID=MMETSP0019_2-20121128/16410_1 /TAXON_ID=98059 /ORGANISM="Dinobryon sp., Strain UTEXLB2267" /LENGTH=212 /DNA_ID=CAMNT_0010294077 /DNA_START=346 /DNA_END=984 /DNA_ORIENTATION=-